jgi:hypothetical protein
MSKAKPGLLAYLYSLPVLALMVVTPVAAHSFPTDPPSASTNANSLLPSAPDPQAAPQSIPHSTDPQTTPPPNSPPQQTQPSTSQSVQQSVEKSVQAVQDSGSAALTTMTTTANRFALRGKTVGERYLNSVDAGYLGVSGKWDVTVAPGEHPTPFSSADKIKYAGIEEFSPFTVFDAAWSAGYEQLRDGVPHYGTDKGAYGERLGAAAFRQGTYRLFGDGVFPALTHEDPRYYRVAHGSIWHRGTHSVLQVVESHRDDGAVGLNYSTFAGEVVANTLPLPFYPARDVTASKVATGIGFSLLDDAALKLAREFLPDLLRGARMVPAQ